jgi:hypothetical protein
MLMLLAKVQETHTSTESLEGDRRVESKGNALLTRRAFAGAAAFMIVPRYVLGGKGYVPPSDRITVASIGMGRQGQVVTMNLLNRPDVQVVAVCDCNRGSKDYVEYGNNALLKAARKLLGPGHQNWGQDLASPVEVDLKHDFHTSLGMGGREPAKRLVEAYYSSRNDSRSGGYKGCTAYVDYRELLDKEKDLDAVYVATPGPLACSDSPRGNAQTQARAGSKTDGALNRRRAAHGANGTRDESGELSAC